MLGSPSAAVVSYLLNGIGYGPYLKVGVSYSLQVNLDLDVDMKDACGSGSGTCVLVLVLVLQHGVNADSADSIEKYVTKMVDTSKRLGRAPRFQLPFNATFVGPLIEEISLSPPTSSSTNNSNSNNNNNGSNSGGGHIGITRTVTLTHLGSVTVRVLCRLNEPDATESCTSDGAQAEAEAGDRSEAESDSYRKRAASRSQSPRRTPDGDSVSVSADGAGKQKQFRLVATSFITGER
jgi:hypothetical protein